MSIGWRLISSCSELLITQLLVQHTRTRSVVTWFYYDHADFGCDDLPPRAPAVNFCRDSESKLCNPSIPRLQSLEFRRLQCIDLLFRYQILIGDFINSRLFCVGLILSPSTWYVWNKSCNGEMWRHYFYDRKGYAQIVVYTIRLVKWRRDVRWKLLTLEKINNYSSVMFPRMTLRGPGGSVGRFSRF